MIALLRAFIPMEFTFRIKSIPSFLKCACPREVQPILGQGPIYWTPISTNYVILNFNAYVQR